MHDISYDVTITYKSQFLEVFMKLKIFVHCFIAEYTDDHRLKIESKTWTSVDILEHLAVVTFCEKARTILMEINKFFDATADGPHVFIYLKQRFTIGIRGWKTDILHTARVGSCTWKEWQVCILSCFTSTDFVEIWSHGSCP